jgi:hypothetical protein
MHAAKPAANIILPVVMYGYDTFSVTLKEEYSVKVIEEKALRRIFGPEERKVTESWRKLYIEKLDCVYSSPDFMSVIESRRMRWSGQGNACRVW